MKVAIPCAICSADVPLSAATTSRGWWAAAPILLCTDCAVAWSRRSEPGQSHRVLLFTLAEVALVVAGVALIAVSIAMRVADGGS